MDGPLIGIGGAAVGAALMALLQWSLTRNVKHEDATKKAHGEKLEELSKEMDSLRQLVNNTKLSSEMQASNLLSKLGDFSNHIGELKGTLTSLTGTVEQNRDKMSAYYRAEMERLEGRVTKMVEEVAKRRGK